MHTVSLWQSFPVCCCFWCSGGGSFTASHIYRGNILPSVLFPFLAHAFCWFAGWLSLSRLCRCCYCFCCCCTTTGVHTQFAGDSFLLSIFVHTHTLFAATQEHFLTKLPELLVLVPTWLTFLLFCRFSALWMLAYFILSFSFCCSYRELRLFSDGWWAFLLML